MTLRISLKAVRNHRRWPGTRSRAKIMNRCLPSCPGLAAIFSISILLMMLSPPFAHGDGAVIPTYVGDLPEIPAQRAILAYRDGIETLVIETSFMGKGEQFG